MNVKEGGDERIALVREHDHVAGREGRSGMHEQTVQRDPRVCR